MSCAKDDDEARVSPATTARMVANATAEMVASRIAPQAESTPPMCRASSGAAVLPDGLDAMISSCEMSAAAPKPSAMVIR